MCRRRVILTGLLAIAATFVVAVQRDTFVRRWLVPPHRPLLNRIVPRFHFVHEYSDQHIAKLAAAAGVRIEMPEGREHSWANEETITDVTVDELLWRFLNATGRGRNDPPMLAVEADGLIRVLPPGTGPIQLCSYDVADLLPSPEAASPDSRGLPGSARESSCLGIRVFVSLAGERTPAMSHSHVHVFGTRLFVVGVAEDQRAVRLMLEVIRNRWPDLRQALRSGTL